MTTMGRARMLSRIEGTPRVITSVGTIEAPRIEERPPLRLTKNEQTAVLLMLLFASIAYDGPRADDGEWYEWTTKRFSEVQSVPGRELEAAAWWAMRILRDHEEHHEDAYSWLGYVGYLREQHARTWARGGAR